MGEAIIAGNDLVVGDGVPSAFGNNGHAFAIGGMAADGGIHCAGILADAAINHRLIHAAEAMVAELIGKEAVGKIVFGNDEQTGGIHIDAVDNSGALFPADAAEAIAAVI